MSGKPLAKKSAQDGHLSETREAMKTVREISRLLNTGLDDNSLRICVQLCEAGVNPEALATVIQELRRETAALTLSIYTYHCHRCGSMKCHTGLFRNKMKQL